MSRTGLPPRRYARLDMPEPKIYPDPPKPDGLAVAVRGAFGVVAGLVLATVLWFRLDGLSLWPTVVDFVSLTAFCVFGAIKMSDAFWERLLRGESFDDRL